MSENRNEKDALRDEIESLRRQLESLRAPAAGSESDRSWFRAHYLGMPIPTYLWRCENDDFILLDYNEAAEKITRGRIAGLVGVRAIEFYADRPQIIENFRECCCGKTVIRREMRYKFKSIGDDRILAVVFVFLNPDLIIVHMEDVTEFKRAEESLRESEEKYRTLVEMFPHTVAIFQDHKVAFANQAAARMLGYDTAEGIIGLDVLAPVPPEEVARLEGYLVGLLNGDPDTPNSFRAYLRRKDGSPFTTEVFANAISFRGRPAVQLVVTDITEREKAENSLRESEERFRAIWEHSPVGICLTDRHGVYHYVNKAYCDIYGYSKEELIGRSFFDTILPLGHPRADRESYAGYFDNPGFRPLAESDIFVHKDGGSVAVQYASDFIKQNGGVKYMVTMNIDITERKNAQEALRESEEKHKLLFDNAVEAITSFDYDGRVTLMNKAAAAYLGGAPESYIGKNLTDIFPAQQAARFLESVRRVMATGAAFSCESLVYLPGQPRWFRNNLQPVVGYDGQVKETLLMATDIHAEKQIRIRNEARYSLLERLRRVNDIDSCLGYSCQAIVEAQLFQRAVLTLHNEVREITHLGQAGLDEATVKAASRAPAPAPELAREMTREEFRIGHSYFLPVESGVLREAFERQIPQPEAPGPGTYPWRAGDELFVPLMGGGDRREGWLSVDTPFDGMRPSLDTVNYLEELIDITAKYVHEIQNLENLRREQLALHEKNIALREVLGHIEEDKAEFRRSIRASIDQVLIPALDKLINKDGTVNRTSSSILKSRLPELGKTTETVIDLYPRLSPREREICDMIRTGASSKGIADTLNISLATVKKHREVIRRKLGINHTKIGIAAALRGKQMMLMSYLTE